MAQINLSDEMINTLLDAIYDANQLGRIGRDYSEAEEMLRDLLAGQTAYVNNKGKTVRYK